MTERLYKGRSLFEFPDDYTVVDIETNGMSACEILEISAIRVRDNVRVKSFSSLIKPYGFVYPFITELTGITNADVADAPPLETVLGDFLSFAADDILLGYNVNFDIDFLYDASECVFSAPLKNDFVDVLRLARRAFKKGVLPDRKQTTVARHFGIDTVGAHRALRDCEICDECYKRLRQMLAPPLLG